jgi:hypothetical protein
MKRGPSGVAELNFRLGPVFNPGGYGKEVAMPKKAEQKLYR